MTIYTTLPNGELSTEELDNIFERVRNMETNDQFGRTDALKTAMMFEAMFEAWQRRHFQFGDSQGMSYEARLKAVEWYRKHADNLESLTNNY